MKKQVILMILLLLAVSAIFCTPVSLTQVRRVAANWGLEIQGSPVRIASILPLNPDKRGLIYIVNLNPQGFIILSGDDAAQPVLGYDFQTKWDEAKLPVQLRELLYSWQEQMDYIALRNLTADAAIRAGWQRLDMTSARFSPRPLTRDIAPMIQSTWGQEDYYNDACPGNTPAGCVAVAMGQIMKYWSYPTTGTGTHSYTHPVYGTLSADFSAATYNWAAMPNIVTSANTAVATLLYHCGVAVDMDYAPTGSGAFSTDVAPALINYFKYKSTAQYRLKSSYTDTAWETLLRGEFDAGRPVYYAGSGGAGGHAFILDGYQGTNHFHVNWGWYGYYNGYYYLTALNPGTYSFTSQQDAVTNIEPTPLGVTEGFEGTTFPPLNWSVAGSPTWVRTTNASYIITGTASAMYRATGNTNGRKLKTPLLSISSTSSLVYKARASTTLYSEQIRISYSANGTTWTNIANSTITLTSTSTTYTLSLSSLTPGDYYLSFDTLSSNTGTSNKTYIVDDVQGPPLAYPLVGLNLTSWDGGTILPGQSSLSGDVFQLSNTGGGTLTITSVTSLTGTEFSTDFNAAVTLVPGQVHQFGFTYEPLNYGTDSQVFSIVTNGGTVTINLTGASEYPLFYDSFENYDDFALSFPPWTQVDEDLRPSYSISNYTFTNQGYTGSYIIFNPNSTTPVMTGDAIAPKLGSKFAACFSAVPNTSVLNNSDWLITPVLNLATNPRVKFWAKSYTSNYGLERFKVLVSTTDTSPGSFTMISDGTYVEAPVAWTQYSYNLPANCANNANVYIAIQCVSADAFIFMLDEFSVIDDSAPPPPLFGNLNGYVYQYSTTTPIQNALVRIGTKQAYTNINGFYQINNIVTGSYTVYCSTPGMNYFATSASGVTISNGVTTPLNFSLKWAELSVNPTSFNVTLQSEESSDQLLTIANPGGTDTLQFAMTITNSATSTGRTTAELQRRTPPEALDSHLHPFTPVSRPQKDRASVAGWMGYTDVADADYYSGSITQRATYFGLSDFAVFASGVTISQIRHYFYEPSTNLWGTNDNFHYVIYGPDGATVLWTSPQITAQRYSTATIYNLPTPLTVTDDFVLAVVPIDATDGKPFSIGTDAVTGHSIYGEPGAWYMMDIDLCLDVNITGNVWLSASALSGSVAPGQSLPITLHFDSADLAAGTKHALLTIYNNSTYVAPSGRGDNLIVPISLTTTVPTVPTARLNLTTWDTTTTVGTPVTSGDIFQLKNIGQGTLTITSASSLTGTGFSTNFNSAVTLTLNQTHNFGFTYTPTIPGVNTATFTIVTNGGTKTISLSAYAVGSTYVVEGFEGTTFPPDGWQMLDADNDTYNWYRYTTTGSAHDGTASAASASWATTALTPDNWLITPRLAIGANDILVYWIAAQDPAWPAEKYSVLVSTTTPDQASFTQTVYSESLTDGNWHRRILNLSAFSGQSIFIAFRHFDCTDQFILKLDDIQMPPFAAPLQYGHINGRVRYLGSGDAVEGATLTIYGKTATTDENGVYSIENIVTGSYTLACTATGCADAAANVTILANTTITQHLWMDWRTVNAATVNYPHTMPANSAASLPVTLSNPGTLPATWNGATGIWGGDAPLDGNLNQDFETVNWTGWSGWLGSGSDIYTGYGYEGTPTSKAFVFVSLGCNTNQWLITPKLHVLSGDILAFWYKQFNNSSEQFDVLISTTTADTSAFTVNLAQIGPLSNTNWTQFSQSLNAYAGQNIWIAFKYAKYNTQYAYIFLDQITGPQCYLPPQNWLTVTPTSGTINAGETNLPISLQINSAGMVPGTYTAQAWLSSNGIASPLILYVTLTVTGESAPTVPQNVLMIEFEGNYELGWDPADNFDHYNVYASSNPYGGWSLLTQTDREGCSVTTGQLIALGIDPNRAFFQIKSDNSAIRTVASSPSAPDCKLSIRSLRTAEQTSRQKPLLRF